MDEFQAWILDHIFCGSELYDTLVAMPDRAWRDLKKIIKSRIVPEDGLHWVRNVHGVLVAFAGDDRYEITQESVAKCYPASEKAGKDNWHWGRCCPSVDEAKAECLLHYRKGVNVMCGLSAKENVC